MKEYRTVCLVILVAAASVASASLTISMPSLKDSVMRVEYTFLAEGRGTKEYVFPDNGFNFAAGPLHVLSVSETESGKELGWEMATPKSPPQKQAIKIFFAYPLTGKGVETRVVAEAKTRNMSVDEVGRFTYRYSTSHDVKFELPAGQAVVYTNYPVTVYEQAGHTVLEIRGTGGAKELMIKTRELKAGSE
jgi:hypothetical protein